MSIDRIGKAGGPLPPAGEIGGLSSTQRAGQPFQVGPVAVDPVAPSALERLRSGDITMPQYLDGRVEEATRHLVGRIDDEQLSFIRQTLREQLSSDPALIDWVRSATGALPKASDS